MEIEKRKHSLDMGIITLWIHWVVGTGALVIPVALGLFIPKGWLPIIVMLEVVTLYYYIQTSAVTYPRCYLIINTCARALIISAVVMIFINWIYTSGNVTRIYEERTLNSQIPYIPVLIVAPAALICALWAVIRGRKASFCQNCIRRYGTASERGFIGFIYKREGKLQVILLAWLAALITVYSWVYYLVWYVNVNINKPDVFFFMGISLILYVVGLIYTALRYSGILSYYSLEMVGSARQRGAITQMRYIMVHEDSVFLAPSDPGISVSKLDTPFSLTIRYRKEVGLDFALDDFRNLSHVSEATIKYLYTSESGNLDGTIRHYIAIIDDPSEFQASRFPGGRWITFYELKRMAVEGKLAPLMTAEVNRVYTITMAWKTYDRNGKRLYKIKNYRPSFHLSQLPKLDVDFNDNRWLFIAANNEDRSFFRLRRFIKKMLFGRDI